MKRTEADPLRMMAPSLGSVGVAREVLNSLTLEQRFRIAEIQLRENRQERVIRRANELAEASNLPVTI